MRMDDSSQVLAGYNTMFRPPVNRAMRALDRSFFRKEVPLASARVLDKRAIAKCRSKLDRDLLQLKRVTVVRQDPDMENMKVLLLQPNVQPEHKSTWSTRLQELVQESQVAVTPYNLELNYDHWDYHDIITAILPEDKQVDLPTGFTSVGHVAHLNLRDQYLPYKHLIAEVLLDKNPTIRTVINKIDDVGEESEYRTFNYELLAGEDNMNVEVSEDNCIYHFDYSKVYWNSRLSTEHRRLVDIFQPGEAVCDVMAGVGPFAIPAGRKKVFVRANDLNPDSHASLLDAIDRNKVSKFVTPSHEDGRSFIRTAAQKLLKSKHYVEIPPKVSRNAPRQPTSAVTVIEEPKTFNHYVMNLPASALSFLPAFKGLYYGHGHHFVPRTNVKLPMIHVYCFNLKSDDKKAVEASICHEVSDKLGHTVSPEDEELTIWDVRDVAPAKRMFCVSFRLPADVAFCDPNGNPN